jgi:hypothetical protein
MKLAIADPPYLGRANRWYGDGSGDGYGKGRADSHPEAKIWDDPQTHKDLVAKLENNYDGWAIALTVHSLSTYLEVIKTDSRNGIRVMSWIKPIAIPSGSRIATSWEPVIVRVPNGRKGHDSGVRMKDHLIANPTLDSFRGSKPKEWTTWVLDAMGYRDGDIVDDLFYGSGAITQVIEKVL